MAQQPFSKHNRKIADRQHIINLGVDEKYADAIMKQYSGDAYKFKLSDAGGFVPIASKFADERASEFDEGAFSKQHERDWVSLSGVAGDKGQHYAQSLAQSKQAFRNQKYNEEVQKLHGFQKLVQTEVVQSKEIRDRVKKLRAGGGAYKSILGGSAAGKGQAADTGPSLLGGLQVTKGKSLLG